MSMHYSADFSCVLVDFSCTLRKTACVPFLPYAILPQHYNKTRLPFSVLHLFDSKYKKALDKPCSIVYNDIEINNSYYF